MKTRKNNNSSTSSDDSFTLITPPTYIPAPPTVTSAPPTYIPAPPIVTSAPPTYIPAPPPPTSAPPTYIPAAPTAISVPLDMPAEPELTNNNIENPESSLFEKKLSDIHYRLKEFLENGQNLSSNMASTHTEIQERISTIHHSLEPNWLILAAQSLSRTLNLAELENPFFSASKLVETKNFNLSIFFSCIDIFYQNTTQADFNATLKQRANNCTWLTLFLTPLIQGPLQGFNQELLIAFQRITRIPLFADAGINDIEELKQGAIIDTNTQEQLNDANEKLKELTLRSKAISIAVNAMQQTLIFLNTCNKHSQKYENIYFQYESSITQFIDQTIDFILEQDLASHQNFNSAYIQNKILTDFERALSIHAMDKNFYAIHLLLDNSKTKRLETVKKLRIDLNQTYNNDSLTNDEKRLSFIQILNACALSIKNGLRWPQKTSELLLDLKSFISRINSQAINQTIEEPRNSSYRI